MADYDLVIIGAGIAGLSMAHYAATAGWNTLVLEQQQQPGGCIHSYRFNELCDGFWLELGAHSSFNSYGHLLSILESMRVLDQLQKRANLRFRLFVDNKTRSIGSQLYIPELLLAPFRLFGANKQGRSVADYYQPLVGRRNYKAVFEPAFDAVICQPAAAFPASALFQARPRRKEIPRSFTLAGGLQTMTDVLARQAGIQVEFGQTVRRISREGGRFTVGTDDGEYVARTVSIATPVAVARQLVGQVLPEIATQLQAVDTAEVETIGVVVRAECLALPPIAGLIGRRQPFYSVVSRDTVPHSLFRGFTFHFRPGTLSAADHLDYIAQVLNLPNGVSDLAQVVNRHNQLPVLRVGHDERMCAVDKALATTGVALTGNYFAGVAIEDCVTRSQVEFRRLQQEMAK